MPDTRSTQPKPTNSFEGPSLEDLQAKAKDLGFPNPEIFTVKKQLIAVIGDIKGRVVVNKKKAAPLVNHAISDAKRWSGKALIMKKKLDGQPKVHVFLSLTGKEKPGAVKEITGSDGKRKIITSGAIWPVIQNGHCTLVPKGVPVMVPQQVQEALGQSQLKTSVAGNEFLVDRDEQHEGISMQEALG